MNIHEDKSICENYFIFEESFSSPIEKYKINDEIQTECNSHEDILSPYPKFLEENDKIKTDILTLHYIVSLVCLFNKGWNIERSIDYCSKSRFDYSFNEIDIILYITSKWKLSYSNEELVLTLMKLKKERNDQILSKMMEEVYKHIKSLHKEIKLPSNIEDEIKTIFDIQEIRNEIHGESFYDEIEMI